MECLSLMLKEGDDWLAQLAEVLEGAPDKPTTGPSPPPSPQRRDSKLASAADACCANGVIGRRGGGTCDGEGGRRTRSRGASHAVDGSGSKTVGCEGSAGAGSSSTRSSKGGEVGGGGNGKRPERNGKVKSVDAAVMKPSRPEVKRESGAPSGNGKSPTAATRGGAAASLGRGKRVTGCSASGRKDEVGEANGRLSSRQAGARSGSVSGTRSRVSLPSPPFASIV